MSIETRLHAVEEYLKILQTQIQQGGDATVSVDVGTTTTGGAGTNASVVNSGDNVHAVFDFTIPRGEKGAKGDKGDAFTYADFTPTQLAGLKQDISTFYKKEESVYLTETAGQTTIPIGITGFRSTDILFVDVNGLDLVIDEDYTVSGSTIILTTGISVVGTPVHFVALRCVAVTPQDYSALKGDTGGVTGVKGNDESSYRTGNVNLTPANVGAVNKDGDTMTGALTINDHALYVKQTEVDATKADNGITANKYIALVGREKGNKETGRFGFGALVDGRTRTEMYVRNYDADGNMVGNKGFAINMDKSGNITYGVSQPEQLRTALSLQEFIDLNAILRDGIAPDLSMTNWTTVNCSGSITTWLSNVCSGYCIKLSGRIAITNFSRTGTNAGASCQLGVKPKKAISSKVVGFRAESPREIVYVDVNTNGLATFKTSESYTNASGSTLTFIIPNWIVNFNN